MEASAERVALVTRSNVTFHNLRAADNVVFFGKSLGPICQRCGAYDQTSHGHKYCAHIACPIALLEFRRRQRKRTSTLEKVLLPRFERTLAEGWRVRP